MNMFWEIKEVVAGEEHQCFAYRHIQDHHPYNNFSWFDKQAVRKFKRNGCRIKRVESGEIGELKVEGEVAEIVFNSHRDSDIKTYDHHPEKLVKFDSHAQMNVEFAEILAKVQDSDLSDKEKDIIDVCFGYFREEVAKYRNL